MRLRSWADSAELLRGRRRLLAAADTCSAEADDCSATDAISLVALPIVSARTVMSTTAWPMDSNACRVRCTVSTDSRVPSALAVTTLAAPAGLSLDLADQARDPLGGLLALLGKLPDLLGHDGEPASLLAGPGGLDRRVQGQQVRLGGDARDRLDDPADLARPVGEAAHGARELGCRVGQRPGSPQTPRRRRSTP